MTQDDMDACIALLMEGKPVEHLRGATVWVSKTPGDEPLPKKVLKAAAKCGAIIKYADIRTVFDMAMQEDEGW
jgi:hypothetical protein